MNLHRAPALLIEPRAWRKILTYVQLSPVEINGWAFVESINSSLLYVRCADDVFITEQVVSAGSADVTNDTAAMAQYNAMIAGRSEDLRLQWHSHVKGAPIFSKTDTDTMDRYESGGATWMVSVVLNKFGQVTARLDMYTPLRASLDLAVYLEQAEDKALVEACADEMINLMSVQRTIPAVYEKGKIKTQASYYDAPMADHDLTTVDVKSNHIPLNKLS